MTAPLVFITGASSGIGQAFAAHYAAAGWRLALVARRGDVMQAWLTETGLGPERAQVHLADMRDVDGVIAAARDCLQRQGLPDVVIAAAGISVGMDTAERDDIEVMREVLTVNTIGMAATFHAFVAPMRAARLGTLVGIASVAAVRGLPGHGAYCASKAAVVTYCESLRVELADSGVKVVTLLPGYIATPMTRGNPYPMPFLMPVDAFVQSAARAIAHGDRVRVIPWPMAWLARVLRILPGAVYDRLIAGRKRKPRRQV
jgi:short-subunit dehydrogenase